MVEVIILLMAVCPIPVVVPEAFNQYPQGYYPFEESPAKIPPKVRKPPYLQTQVNCPGKYKNRLARPGGPRPSRPIKKVTGALDLSCSEYKLLKDDLSSKDNPLCRSTLF